jgi:3',5'-cyclic AMP phosphodiesterase CpdA
VRGLFCALLCLTSQSAFAEPLRIAVISDMNGSYGSTDYGTEVSGAVSTIISRQPDLVISTGDMVAGQRGSPKLSPEELRVMWAAFHGVVSDPLAVAGLPLLVTPGNHDASAYPGFEAERMAFADAWADRLPLLEPIDASAWPFRGAWSVRGVLLVGIDATKSGPLAAEDMTWLRGILNAEAGRHRTVLLFGHLPLMPISQGREGDVLADPALFELARVTGVDMWLSGHQHAFYSGMAGGILFVAQAALGNGPRKLIGEAETSPQAFTWIEIEENGAVSVAAFPAPAFAAPVAESALPPALGTGAFALTRALSRRD